MEVRSIIQASITTEDAIDSMRGDPSRTPDNTIKDDHRPGDSDAVITDDPVITDDDDDKPPSIPSTAKLMKLRSKSNSRRNFAKKIAVVSYSEKERLESNVNGKAGKKKLDPERMDKLREAVFLLYPLEYKENMKEAWRVCKCDR